MSSYSILYRRYFLSLLLLALIGTPFAFGASYAQQKLEDLASSSALTPGQLGVLVLDLATGDTIAAVGNEKSLIPASVMKAVTTASLIRNDNASRPLVTKVYADGPVSRGTLHGNLLVIASGDPTLNASTGPSSPDIITEIIEALKNKKINQINGSIQIEESIFEGPEIPASWLAADLPHYYGTGCHGFNFESNASGKKSVSNPAGVFKTRLLCRLNDAGIEVKEETSESTADRQLLVAHESAPLADIMWSCMFRSDNLYAEALLRMVSLASEGRGSTAEGARKATEFWNRQKAPMDGVTIIDGSGLSRSNRLTANFLGDVLRKMHTDEIYASFFPLVGEEGTVKNFMKDTPLAGYLALKTGSMKGIQCYAGYKVDEDYAPTHVVVVMVNGLNNREKFRTQLADFFLDIFSR